MDQLYITGPMLKDMMLNAAAYLEKNKSGLDALNVFPVPDGDTGTNMSLTMMSAAKELMESGAETVCDVANAIALGALKGARGNSGVILSQIFRGFAKGLEGIVDTMDAVQFANAIDGGSKSAYKAVMKPKEGTILTIARAMGECALEQAEEGADVLNLLDNLLLHAEETLRKTPEMLPVLKEAGVVDAGGKGLLIIYRAFKMSLDGDDVDYDFEDIVPSGNAMILNEDIEFGYCTEFFIKNIHDHITQDHIERLREKLTTLGDCVLVVGDLNLIKVHVHTNMPGKALQIALRFGMLSGIKIDNMREQHNEGHTIPQKELAIIAVAYGDGIKAIFKDFSVDYIVEGGQTMNPSAEDIARAIVSANAHNAIILPNNKNIILAAEQAGDLVDCNVMVVHATSIPQGIAATLKFNPDLSPEENFNRMNNAVSDVKSGQITKAVRIAKVNGHNISEGDYIGLFDGEIVVHGKSKKKTAIALLKEMVTEDDCVITAFYGSDVSEENANELLNKITDEFPGCDVDVQLGGQPVYEYIFSVE